MFGETITIAPSGANKALDRKGTGDGNSRYSLIETAGTKTTTWTLIIRHSSVKATKNRPAAQRHNVELVRLVRDTTLSYDKLYRSYVVFETPLQDLEETVTPDALMVWLLAGSPTALLKIMQDGI